MELNKLDEKQKQLLFKRYFLDRISYVSSFGISTIPVRMLTFATVVRWFNEQRYSEQRYSEIGNSVNSRPAMVPWTLHGVSSRFSENSYSVKYFFCSKALHWVTEWLYFHWVTEWFYFHWITEWLYFHGIYENSSCWEINRSQWRCKSLAINVNHSCYNLFQIKTKRLLLLFPPLITGDTKWLGRTNLLQLNFPTSSSFLS